MTQTAAARADRATTPPEQHLTSRSTGPRARRLATGTGATLALAAVAVTATAGGAQADEEYTVRSGDTVSHIAARYGTTVAAVRSSNGLDSNAFITEGQLLTIPTTSATSSSTTATTSSSTHTVASGETVSAIAASYGTTVSAIVSANGLDSSAFIRAGQTLTIPAASSTSTASTSTATTATTSSSSTHTVASGETVSAIAASYGTTVSAIVSANGLDSSAFIRAGQTLTIPAASSTSSTSTASSTTTTSGLVGSTFAGRTYSATVVASANENKATLLSMDVPSTSEMQAKVAATAVAMGVDPALAQAVAYQESGFDQTAVSPANAIGTMQVIPSAGEWASQLVGRELNLLDPDDNVVAGIAILRSLLNTSSDLSTAIASYYQGATSVKNNGMYSDTRRYVANVQTLMTRY
ncbi:MAG TPA: LysM peptidoglycan-binding domain-containing protein [Cellulomonas sp.]